MDQASASPLFHVRQEMSNTGDNDLDLTLQNFAAVLVEAVYPVALQHEGVDSWVELELDLWKVLTETLNGWSAARVCLAKGD
jgi:hypothetical protein